jgi:hypothetical protein
MPFTINVRAGIAPARSLLKLQSVGLQQCQEVSNIYARVGTVRQVVWISGPGGVKKAFGLFEGLCRGWKKVSEF